MKNDSGEAKEADQAAAQDAPVYAKTAPPSASKMAASEAPQAPSAAPRAVALDPTPLATSQAVSGPTAYVNQAMDLNVRVTVVGTGAIPSSVLTQMACQPRHGAPRRKADAMALPASLMAHLNEGAKGLSNWLARDPANVRAFATDPVAALEQAGVRLERADLKALARLRTENATAAVVHPGVQLRSVQMTVDPGGKVPREERTSDDCGCP